VNEPVIVSLFSQNKSDSKKPAAPEKVVILNSASLY